MNLKYDFGNVLKLLIFGNKMTIPEFTEKVGESDYMMSLYLCDNVIPNDAVMKRMAKVLGVSLYFLKNGFSNPDAPERDRSGFKAAYSIALYDSDNWSEEDKKRMIRRMTK